MMWHAGGNDREAASVHDPRKAKRCTALPPTMFTPTGLDRLPQTLDGCRK